MYNTAAVCADVHCRLPDGLVDSRLPPTALAPASECLELRGRDGRRSHVAVCSPVRRDDGP